MEHDCDQSVTKPSWLYIEPDLTLWQNLRLRFWFLGMDLCHAVGARRAYLFCVGEAGRLSYGEPPPGPDGPPEAWPF